MATKRSRPCSKGVDSVVYSPLGFARTLNEIN